MIFLPSFAVFIGGLSELYLWRYGAVTVATINLFAVFLGSILQVSSKHYYDDWRGGSNEAKTH
ncbi:MAG: phage holin [Atopostipes suicloacalis]|nr:phage holin [Atopostipes suicloacalis]